MQDPEETAGADAGLSDVPQPVWVRTNSNWPPDAPDPVPAKAPDPEPEDDSQRREGLSRSPQAVFDPKKRLMFHLDANGERRYHGCPAGFAYDDSGVLIPAAD